MKVGSARRASSRQARLGFALAEVLVAVLLIATVFVTLYLAMSGGFAITKKCREELRATQILLERMEGIRLYNWDQLCYSNMIPTSFISYYYPLATNGESKGIVYGGKITVGPAAMNPSASYGDRLRAITVTVTWTNQTSPTVKVVHTRTMTTYSARDGVQNYVFNN